MHNADLSQARSCIPANVLAGQAQIIGDDLFLVDDTDTSWSYGEVDALADRYAGGLADLGVSKGDTVAFFMENSAEQAVWAFAVNRLGAIWSPICTDYRGEWLMHNIEDIGARVLIVDSHLVHEFQRVGACGVQHAVINGSRECTLPPSVNRHRVEDFRSLPARRPDVSLYHGDTSAVLWTSGTTGRSKGVMQSHHAWMMWSAHANDFNRKGVREGERFYGCTPMYNSGGWIMNIYPALASGTPACIDKRFSVRDYWDRIRHYRASHTMTLGSMHLYLAAQPPSPDDAGNTLRVLHMTPIVPRILRPFMERFGIETVFSGFGQSEVMGATFWRDDLGLDPASCGLASNPDAPVETRLLDEDDKEVPVGDTGEICVRGRQPFVIFSGYFNNPQATVEASRNLWHHTGDLGRLGKNGELYFVDRKKDSTRHKGRNISSFEVEHTVRQFPGVAVAAAVGIRLPELHSEDELLIAVVPSPGAEIDPLALCQFIDANAPYFFVPRYVWITDKLPMTPTQKVQKYLIREAGLPEDVWDLHAESEWRPTRKNYRDL